MKYSTALRQRYLRDPSPVRLGGLAANLARIESFSDHVEHGDVVESLLEESKFLIEWAAPDVRLDVQAELAEMQVQLALWELNWTEIWSDLERRMAVAAQAQLWSKRVLEMSGLLS
jgi:hypothetical protein